MVIYTAGYEGISIESFVARLVDARIGCIIDVRELPLSRKRGFSKAALAEALALAGIVYEHRRALGCPRPIRDRYRVDGDWAAYTRAFMKYLGTLDDELDDLADVLSDFRCALLCYEADPAHCHRSYVAEALSASTGARVMHLSFFASGHPAVVKTAA